MAKSDNAPRLKKFYEESVRKTMQDKFNYSNAMQMPKVEKIVLNMGVGKALANKKMLDIARENLSLIAGQKACVTKSRKSVARFGLRRSGIPIGCSVVLSFCRTISVS